MSKQEDGMAAKVRGLEDRVTVLEAKAGVFASPTGAEVLAAKNAAKAKRIAAEAALQDAADKKAAAAKAAAKKTEAKAGAARLEVLTAVALVMVTGMLAWAGNLWKLSDKTYVTDTDTLATSNLTVSGTATIGTLNASVTNFTASGLSGNIAVARMTNAMLSGTALVTNDVIVAGNTTNRWILTPVGGTYVVKSITAL